MTDIKINIHAIILGIIIVSPIISSPNTVPLIGSNVLKIATESALVSRNPIWKSITAITDVNIEINTI
ncbi:MAG: hypothetical protein RR444_06265 [Oscillospiraceae bacterium]